MTLAIIDSVWMGPWWNGLSINTLSQQLTFLHLLRALSTY